MKKTMIPKIVKPKGERTKRIKTPRPKNIKKAGKK